jgi:hypothetical protein
MNLKSLGIGSIIKSSGDEQKYMIATFGPNCVYVLRLNSDESFVMPKDYIELPGGWPTVDLNRIKVYKI